MGIRRRMIDFSRGNHLRLFGVCTDIPDGCTVVSQPARVSVRTR